MVDQRVLLAAAAVRRTLAPLRPGQEAARPRHRDQPASGSTDCSIRVRSLSLPCSFAEVRVIAADLSFQQYALFPWLTVRANVEFALRLRGVDRRQRRAEAMHWLDLVHLADVAEALPKELSGGMKQRCAIARAYAAHPTVLLMDEPFGAVDALTRVRLQDQLLETWQREKRTVLFITHDVDEAVYLANRVVVMQADPGRIFRVIDVDLPHPRTEQLRLSEQFALLRNEVWRSVYHQREAAQPTP